MSLYSYFYDRCPECGMEMREGTNPITGASRVYCPKCKTVSVEGFNEDF